MKEASHSNSRKRVQLNREPRALCVKVVRSRGSGIIGVNIGNVLKQVSNISRRISVSNIKHQVSCKFIIRKL